MRLHDAVHCQGCFFTFTLETKTVICGLLCEAQLINCDFNLNCELDYSLNYVCTVLQHYNWSNGGSLYEGCTVQCIPWDICRFHSCWSCSFVTLSIKPTKRNQNHMNCWVMFCIKYTRNLTQIQFLVTEMWCLYDLVTNLGQSSEWHNWTIQPWTSGGLSKNCYHDYSRAIQVQFHRAQISKARIWVGQHSFDHHEHVIMTLFKSIQTLFKHVCVTYHSNANDHLHLGISSITRYCHIAP